MSIERLLADKPALHNWDDGTATSWAASPKVLQFIYDHLKPEMHTLETGAGHTTVVFAMAGTRHTCITPMTEESKNILKYCQQIGLQPDITFLNQSSDEVLPSSPLVPPSLDFVFIDGAHRYPFPCVDFHYTERKLTVGGILGVDDVDMPSVKILYHFLKGEPNWQLLAHIDNTAFFKKVSLPPVIADWQGQQMNLVYKNRKEQVARFKKFVKRFLPF